MMYMHHATPDPVTLPCACTTLRKAARAVTRLYDGALAGAGMNASQLAILRSLNRTGPQPLSRLAETLVMDRTSLYRALRPMIESEWLAIDAAASGRTRIATLTDEGRAAMNAAAEGWETAQNGFVEAFGPEAWGELAGVLQSVVSKASEVGSAERSKKMAHIERPEKRSEQKGQHA
jgi:DNA-binding MarR family transcriptional regulator